MTDTYRYTDKHDTTIGIGVTDDGHDAIVWVRDSRLEGARVRIPADERRAAAEALAGDDYRVVPADRGHARFTFDATCPKCEEGAQPDRPEPVDPASVRIGDFVELTYAGKVQEVRGGDSLALEPGERHFAFKGAEIRVLHAAEPEVDEAAVEALRQAIKDCRDEELGDHFDEPRLALALAKRNVRVVSTDA